MITMIAKKHFFIIFIISLITSCQESKQEQIGNIVSDWIDKELLLPTPTKGLNETFIHPKSDYKIITYIDSTECTACDLQLEQWCLFINEIKSFTQKYIPLIIYVHPNNEDSLEKILRWEDSSFPYIVDKNSTFVKLNKIPKESMFHTFLIDKENKILTIGNPVIYPKIKDLYRKILDIKSIVYDVNKLTSINLNKSIIDFDCFPIQEIQKTEICILNTGNQPLFVSDVISSSECINVLYSKRHIQPNDSIILNISYQARNKGFFEKKLNVYCNTGKEPLQIKIYGKAE